MWLPQPHLCPGMPLWGLYEAMSDGASHLLDMCVTTLEHCLSGCSLGQKTTPLRLAPNPVGCTLGCPQTLHTPNFAGDG